jgi:antitoxin HicB
MKHAGSNFDDFLLEEGLLADAEAVALKRVIAHQLSQAMTNQKLSKVELARRMNTSRAALDRLLDPNEKGVTLQTLERAAVALGKRLEIRLV